MPDESPLRRDLRKHGEDYQRTVAMMTPIWIGLMAYYDRDTNFYESRDYLETLLWILGIPLLFECLSHLWHHRRLTAARQSPVTQGVPRG